MGAVRPFEINDDDLYYCVLDCNHAPFTARKQHSAHQRLCKKAQAHERYLSTLASARQDAEEVLEPSPKQVRVVEPDIGDVAHSPSPDPPPASPPPPPSPSEVVETRNQAPPPPPRLTRAQAHQLDTAFRRERDALPEAPAQLEPLPPPPIDTGARHPASTAHRPHAQDLFRTDPDIFGRYRVYYSRPPRIPDADAPMAHVLPFFQTPPAPRFPRPLCDVIASCPNISVFYVLRYHRLSSNTKSLNDREYLCNEVLLQPDFKPRDLAGINLNAVDKELAAAANNWDPSCPPAEGWKNVPLKLRVPTPSSGLPKRPRKRACLPDPPPEPEPPENYLVIDGLRAQSLTGLMKKTFNHNNIDTFNYDTYQYCWKPPGSSGPAQTLSGEMYTSPAMIRAYREVQGLDIDCDLPRCVAGFMFTSDGMQFAQFSHVKGWPILCSFGNKSKYKRCKPTSNTCFPIAHIPTLPDKVREQITAMHGKPPSDDLITHLRRELMHAVWLSLLDDEFIDAWKNGVVIDCADGIRRRVFPRIMTYSADYPEKVLLATIRNNGKCFCPRCFVTKPTASQMGTPTDMRTRKKRRIDNPKRRATIKQAKHLIHKKGKTVGSKAVEALLKDKSYVPTMATLILIFFATLIVDQLHEVELGVWKALFQHLIRLLHSVGPAAVTEFNRRFRAVPTFASTIQLFADDVADMGRIAARDYEDILQYQCSIPAFKGLLPKICDEPAQTLLFLFAEWHGLAKLRLHTTDSLKIFKSITTKLGTAIRNFVKLTDGLKIRETPKEYARRKKQSEASKAKQMSRRAPTTANTTRANKTSTQQNPDDGDGRHIVTLNLNTYKFHSTGDYPWHVEEYGTSDSYSTQIGELQNRKYKAQYGQTNKRDDIEQMTEIEDIMNTLQAIDKELKESLKRPRPRIDAAAIDSLTEGRPYHIGQKD
ncbi:hypothetical protein FRC12_021702 [Ceratobasidium sp. 428]|nr:hypothetical protein FRC12_021702 [Ceratobasidium sp. 428]